MSSHPLLIKFYENRTHLGVDDILQVYIISFQLYTWLGDKGGALLCKNLWHILEFVHGERKLCSMKLENFVKVSYSSMQ